MHAALPPEPPAATIVVTARALPEPVAERAFSTETIGETALRNAPTNQLDQLLKQVPGLQLFRRSDARSAHPTSQGVTLRALGGNASSRAQLVLDGVPQADPFGGWVNWPAYDPASLAEVRVVRGGGSVAQGPGALAGTIDMKSRLQRGIAGGLEAGTFGTSEARLVAGAEAAGGMLGVSARGARGDGFVPITAATRGPADRRAPFREASLRANWTAALPGAVEAQLAGLAFTDRRERGLAFTGNRTDGADASLRLTGSGRLPWSALAYGQWRELSSSFAGVSPGRASAMRVSLQDSVPSNALGGRFELRPAAGGAIELRLGGDARQVTGESRELYAFADGEPSRRRIAGGQSLTAGMFGEAAASLGRLSLSAGARLDRWRIADGELRERVIATGATLRDDRYDDRSGWLPTARAGAVLDAGGGLDLRSAAYLGWRMPTLNELFRPFRAGADATAANALLEPERLEGAEIGARLGRRGVTLAATAFVNRLEDAIANVTLGAGPGLFPGVGFVPAGGDYRQRRNLDAVDVRGVELSAQARRGAWFGNAGVSLADARVRAKFAAAPLDGQRPAQTPRMSAAASLGWDRAGRAWSVAIRHVGGQFEDDLNRQRLAPATTIDAFAAWPLSQRLQLVMRGENLLDEQVVAGIGGDGSVERAAPRSLALGIRFTGGDGSARRPATAE